MLPKIVLDNLENPSAWFGMAIRHEIPHIDRIWMDVGNDRLCLHRLHPVHPPMKPYYHRHPWACETYLLHGSYHMDLGFGPGPEPPPVMCRALMTAGSKYVMDHPHAWHSVMPLDGPVYSFFHITHRWGPDETVAGICRTRHSRLKKTQIALLLQDFWRISKGMSPLLICSVMNLSDCSSTSILQSVE